MKKVISFQVGFQKVTLKPEAGEIVAIVGNVYGPLSEQVSFNVEKISRRGLTVYGFFLGTFQEFHISAKYFDYKAVKAFISSARESEE